MSLSQMFEAIDEEEKSDLLAKYQSLIGQKQIADVRPLRMAVKNLDAIGVDVDADADWTAWRTVARLESEIEPEPAPDDQSEWEARREQIERETRSATFAAVLKCISELKLIDAAMIGKKLAKTFTTQWNWAERVHEVHYEPQRERQKEIEAICASGDQDAVQRIVEIVADALDEFDVNHWEDFVKSVVQKNIELDRTPIFACIKSGNAKLNLMEEPPEERARRNSDRHHRIRQIKERNPLAFAPPPEEPDEPQDATETSEEPVADPELVVAE